MIPKICANCAHGMNIRDDRDVVATLCSYMPIQVAKSPGGVCGCFEISDTPELFADEPQGGALEQMMGNPMEQVEDLVEGE